MKDKIKENVPLLLTVLSAFLAAIILVEFVQFWADTAEADSFVNTVIKDINNTDAQIAETIKTLKEPADALKKHSIFFPPPKPDQCPVTIVNGIFGDEAIINGKMYKVGAKIGSAEIIKIEAAEVTILWNGKEKKFAPIAAAVKNNVAVVKADPNKQKKQEEEKEVAVVMSAPEEAT